MNTWKRIVSMAAMAVGGLSGSSAVSAATARQAEAPSGVREIEIVVDGGYHPRRILLREGERVRLRFLRKEYGGCTRKVVFPSLGLERELPTGQPVVIELPALAAGEHEFRCGMNMMRGELVVEKA